MSWLRLIVETEDARAESVAEFLEQFGASSISFSGASDEKIFAQPGEVNESLWQRTEVSALLPADVDMDILLVCLKQRIGTEGLLNRRIESVQDQDWVDIYKKSQQALLFSDRICICPSWIMPPESDLPAIILDPGLAFGTGTHATTALCIEWLAGCDIEGKTILDFGCGSGILALAAARLGAKNVYAIDIDPLAVSACEHNVERNDVAKQIIVGLPNEIDIPKVDLIIANVLLNPLIEHAEELSNQVKIQGEVVLSGILSTQVDDCLAVYRDWFTMDKPVYKDEWAMLHGVRD